MNNVEDPMSGTPTDQGGFMVNPDGTVSFGGGLTNNTNDTSSSGSTGSTGTTGTDTCTYISQDDFLASLGLKKDNN